jgi:microcystin-dependent protein
MSEISSSDWNEAAASNTVASPNGFPEGQTAGSLNNGAREVMAAVKRAWGRLNGRYASTGSSNAYVLTPDAALTAYVTGERYSFRANFTNTGTATLNISSLGAKTIKKMGSSGKANLASGDIQSGQSVTVEYDGTDMVMVTPIAGQAGAAEIAIAAPTGMIVPYGGTTAPTGWLLCYGQAISRTDYSALFAVFGTTYGSGDGSTTFNLPDLRGRVIAGQDDMGGTSANRLTGLSGGVDGDVLGATGGAETHQLTTSEIPSHTHSYSGPPNTGSADGGVNARTWNLSGTQSYTSGSTGGGGSHNNIQPTIILNYIVKH